MSPEGPAEPGIAHKLIHFGIAIAGYVADGCADVTPAQYSERLAICDGCPLQRFGKCLICGCNLAAKAKMRSQTCERDPPLWPEIPCET